MFLRQYYFLLSVLKIDVIFKKGKGNFLDSFFFTCFHKFFVRDYS